MIKVTNIDYDLTEFNYTSDIHLDSIENSLDNMGEVINSLTSNVQKTDTLIIMVTLPTTTNTLKDFWKKFINILNT